MIGLYISLGIIALALILLSICYLTYRIAFYQNPKRVHNPFFGMESEGYSKYKERIKEQIKRLEAIPFEDVYTLSRDGLRLRARYHHTKDGAPVMLQCHGYRGGAIRDFSEGASYAIESGFNVLLIDQRAHGESEGRTISFGAKEKLDCLCWIEYIEKRLGEGTPIILNGISMGGATVLLAAALPLPECVKGIVADCPYSSAKEIISMQIRKMRLPAPLIYPLLCLGARIFGRFDINEADVISAARKSSHPTLIIHGEADDFVPCDMSRRILEVSDKQLVSLNTFEGALHGYSFLVDPERYKALLKEFCERILAKTTSEL